MAYKLPYPCLARGICCACAAQRPHCAQLARSRAGKGREGPGRRAMCVVSSCLDLGRGLLGGGLLGGGLGVGGALRAPVRVHVGVEALRGRLGRLLGLLALLALLAAALAVLLAALRLALRAGLGLLRRGLADLREVRAHADDVLRGEDLARRLDLAHPLAALLLDARARDLLE